MWPQKSIQEIDEQRSGGVGYSDAWKDLSSIRGHYESP